MNNLLPLSFSNCCITANKPSNNIQNWNHIRPRSISFHVYWWIFSVIQTFCKCWVKSINWTKSTFNDVTLRLKSLSCHMIARRVCLQKTRDSSRNITSLKANFVQFIDLTLQLSHVILQYIFSTLNQFPTIGWFINSNVDFIQTMEVSTCARYNIAKIFMICSIHSRRGQDGYHHPGKHLTNQ